MKKSATRMIDVINMLLKEDAQQQFKLIVSDDCLLSVVDMDKDSPIHFTVLKDEIKDGKIYYHLSFAPMNDSTMSAWLGVVTNDQFKQTFMTWFEEVKKYNGIYYQLFPKTPPIDHIVESYIKDLNIEFELVDADADTAPFPLKLQEGICNKYDAMIAAVLAAQTVENTESATEIVEELETAKQQVSKSTKRVVFDTFIKLTALCYKYSYNVGKAIAAEVLVEIGKRLIA